MADYRDNVVSVILEQCLKTDQNASLFADFIPVISHHQLFSLKKPGSLRDVIAEINSGLNSSRKRLQSLLLLESMVQQCSAEVFSSHCQTWFNLLLQNLQSHVLLQVQKCTMRVLCLMIERVTSFPELAREIGTNYITQLMPVLLSAASKHNREAAALCISACITYFPGPTGPFKVKIEELLTEELEHASPSGIFVRCFVLLARCSTSGSQGVKHREGWVNLCDKVKSTLKNLLSQLYEGLEIDKDKGQDMIFTNSIPNTQPERTVCLFRRFQIMCSCLEALLREPFPVWIQLPVQEILKLVCRTLALQINMLACKPSSDRVLLLSYLPQIHIAAVKVLSQLIICCRKLLLPHASVICKLLVQNLVSSRFDATASNHNRPYSSLRVTIYKTLSTWLQITGSANHLTGEELDELLQELFNDIQPQQNRLKIDSKVLADSAVNPPPNKKKKRAVGAYQELSQSSVSYHNLHCHYNKELSSSALRVLQLALSTSGTFWHTRKVQSAQQKLVSLVRLTQTQQVLPYTSGTCRQALYQALLALVCIPHPSVPSLMQIGLALFQHGLMDSDFQVAYTCQEAIQRCESLIHPLSPVLHGPVITTNYTLNISSLDPTTASLVSPVTLSSISDIQGTAVVESPSLDLHSLSRMSSSSDIKEQVSTQHLQYTSAVNLQSELSSISNSQHISSTSDNTTETITETSVTVSRTDVRSPQKRKHTDSRSSEEEVSSYSEDQRQSSDEQQEGISEDDRDAKVNSRTRSRETIQSSPLSGDICLSDNEAEMENIDKTNDRGADSVKEYKKQENKNVKNEESEMPSSSNIEETAQSNDVQAMLMSFVDASPDSD